MYIVKTDIGEYKTFAQLYMMMKVSHVYKVTTTLVLPGGSIIGTKEKQYSIAEIEHLTRVLLFE